MIQEVTIEELVQLVKNSKNDFIIHVEFGEEADSDAKKESVQT